MSSKESDRRRFLKNSIALAGLAVGGIGTANALEGPEGKHKLLVPYGDRSRFDNTERIIEREDKEMLVGTTPSLESPIQDLVGIITPGPLHYVNNHGYAPPDIDPAKHRLMIHG